MNNVLILPEDGWKEVSTDSQGSFTLTSGGQHCIHAGQPSELLVGHRYGKKPVQFITAEGESVYVRVSRPCFAVGDVVGGVVPLIQRYFIDLDPVLNSYYLLNTHVTFAGDFEIEFEFTYSLNTGAILGGGGAGNELRFDPNNNRFRFIANGGFTNLVITSVNYNIGTLYKCTLRRVTGLVSLEINGETPTTSNAQPFLITHVGQNGAGSIHFNGIIANPKLTDLVTPANNQTYALGQATGNTETSAEGGDTITYVNVPESNRELFEFDGVTTWDNISPEPQTLPATIEAVS